MERLPCGEKMIKTGTMKFRKKKEERAITQFTKCWLKTTLDYRQIVNLFLLYFTLKSDLEKYAIHLSSNI